MSKKDSELSGGIELKCSECGEYIVSTLVTTDLCPKAYCHGKLSEAKGK